MFFCLRVHVNIYFTTILNKGLIRDFCFVFCFGQNHVYATAFLRIGSYVTAYSSTPNVYTHYRLCKIWFIITWFGQSCYSYLPLYYLIIVFICEKSHNLKDIIISEIVRLKHNPPSYESYYFAQRSRLSPTLKQREYLTSGNDPVV